MFFLAVSGSERLSAARAFQVVPIHALLSFRRDAGATMRAGDIQGRVNLFKIELATGRHWFFLFGIRLETGLVTHGELSNFTNQIIQFTDNGDFCLPRKLLFITVGLLQVLESA